MSRHPPKKNETGSLAKAGVVLVLVLGGSACSSFRKPEPFDDAFLRERGLTKTQDDVRASAALLTDEETRRAFGVDLAKKEIQPVWLEIHNDPAQVQGLARP